jgi:hypothetical protein
MIKNPEEPEGTRPRYMVYFFELFVFGKAIKILEL